ncbi:MAG TPA: hypothetical protein VKI00_15355 [Mycobacterium sp.]|jgi:hypothetical protein|uniref:hypothetical protein n=1 Tax=Mycobacterium sp. TaxID=1785 RepID=UPI002CD292F1|nr:hypothetical protein [Mycobacterium sp.]HME76965.1 hypothetical protein [Mycobacterium sp.]
MTATKRLGTVAEADNRQFYGGQVTVSAPSSVAWSITAQIISGCGVRPSANGSDGLDDELA